MPRLTLVSLIAAATILMAAPRVRAELPNSIGRYLGVGWSDGYHSHTACPPKRHIVHHQPQQAKPVPWWAIPAAESSQPEPLPAPADRQPVSTATSSTSGRSLFRQPGDGSTVSELSALSGATASR